MIIGYSRAGAAAPSVVPPGMAWRLPLSLAPDLPSKRLMPNLIVRSEAAWIAKAAAGDPLFGFTVLTLNMTGANGSNVWTDVSSKLRGNATLTGSPTISTATPPPGGTGAYASNGSTNLHYASSTDFQFNAVAFTLEIKIRPNGTSNTNKGLLWKAASVGTGMWVLWCNTSGNGELETYVYTNGTALWTGVPIASSGITWAANTWYDIAVDFDGTKLRLYRDGVMLASATPASSAMTNTIALPTVGGDSLGGRNFAGQIGGVRITNGIARYATDTSYAIPNMPYPTL